jgi:hypothetical protein
MNGSELRPIDYDAYRDYAHALRRQAIAEAIDGAAAWFRTALSARPATPTRPARAPDAHCPA